MMELHGLTRRVLAELSRFRAGERSDWRSRGEGFHRYVNRARYGTGDPTLVARLIAGGFPKKALEPIHSKECIESLSRLDEYADSAKAYDELCDYTHANARGYFEGSSGFSIKRITTVGGSILIMPRETPVNLYEYPARGKFEKTLQLTAEPMNVHSAGLLMASDGIPESPYRTEEVVEHTGTVHGLVAANQNPQTVSGTKTSSFTQVGRNDRCLCEQEIQALLFTQDMTYGPLSPRLSQQARVCRVARVAG